MNQVGLKKTLSWQALLSMGLGAVVGWSWVIYAGFWSTTGGSMGGIIGFALTGILCSLVAMVYAELTSAYPRVGGDVVFTFEGLGDKFAIVTQWALLIFWVGLVMIETMFLPVIMTRLGIPVPQWGPLWNSGGEPVYLSYMAISVGMNVFFAWLNARGAELSGKIQTAMVYIMLAAAIFFFFSGITLGDASNMKPLFTDVAGFTAIMLMLPGFMAGFNAIPQAAEEGNVSHNLLGKLVIACVWASVIFYLLIVIGLSFAAPLEVRLGEGLVVVDAIEHMFSGNAAARIFVVFASLLGMLTTWNACYLAASRLMLGLSRAKYLPPIFNEIHPQYQTPAKAMAILCAVTSLIALFGTNSAVYVGIINVFSMYIVIAWLLVSISFLRLRDTKPDLPRPYKVKAGKFVGWASIIFCLGFLYLYTPFGPSGLSTAEWIGAGIWALIGLATYFIWNQGKGKVTEEERRKLLRIDEISLEEDA